MLLTVPSVAGEQGFIYEAEQRCVEIVIGKFGLAEVKVVSAFGSREDSGGALQGEHEFCKGDVTKYRLFAVRWNHLSAGRPDIKFAAREIRTHMTAFRAGHFELFTGFARYLDGIFGFVFPH